MASDALIHNRHAWSLMNEKDLAHKLHKLGLIVNSHTGHSIRCWLRSHLADRPYKAPFQLPFRPGTRYRYRGLWRRLLYFCFRLYRLDSTVRQNILRYELTEEQRIALDEVWGDPCWAARPPGGYYNDDVEGEAELELSTRCSSMSSASSWGAESANLSTSVGDSELMRHRKTKMGPASPCKEFKEAARTVNELVEDDEFIALGLDDWPVCEASDDSLECLSPRAIKIVNDGKGKKMKQISRPFHLNDDRSAQADIEVAFAWQSGHRPNQRGTSYGIDGAFPDSLQPALLRVYRWTSDQWHRFIDLKDPMRSQAARQACVAWPDKNGSSATQ